MSIIKYQERHLQTFNWSITLLLAVSWTDSTDSSWNISSCWLYLGSEWIRVDVLPLKLLHKLYNFWPVVAGISRLYPYTQFNNLNMEQWEKIVFQPPFIGRIHDGVSLQGWSPVGMAG